uniref:Uncharacterized protein n=1 Tax=Ananas comosus var. bracteatus TaxID=296719 RepID=A0A6V7NPT2_ANACO|nr:unnamed protein product [Ananas comosus var. bracteatus]
MKTPIHSSPRSAPLLLLLLALPLLLTAAVHAEHEPKVGADEDKARGVEQGGAGARAVLRGEYNNRLRGRDAKPLAFREGGGGAAAGRGGHAVLPQDRRRRPRRLPQDLRCRRLGQALAQISPAHVLHSLH